LGKQQLHLFSVLKSTEILSSTYYLDLLLFGVTATALFIAIVACRPGSNARKFAIACLVYILLSASLSENPLILRWAALNLDKDQLGFRQHGAVREAYLAMRPVKAQRHVVVGSSQADAVFGSFIARTPGDFDMISLAGMSPIDFYLYRQQICDRSTDDVVLYLSAFDLGRPPMMDAIKLGPTQSLASLSHITAQFHRNRATDFRTFEEFVASNRIPLYRNQYIHRGILEYLFGKLQTFGASKDSTDTHFETQMRSLRDLDEKWFPFQMEFLGDFIRYCGQRERSVIVLGGHYHPHALDSNPQIFEKSYTILSKLEEQYSFVRFVDLRNDFELREEDYRDGYHVTESAAQRVLPSILARIRTPDSSEDRGR
jgi:hypothetical protein